LNGSTTAPSLGPSWCSATDSISSEVGPLHWGSFQLLCCQSVAIHTYFAISACLSLFYLHVSSVGHFLAPFHRGSYAGSGLVLHSSSILISWSPFAGRWAIGYPRMSWRSFCAAWRLRAQPAV
jgi:hypothetical protein